VTEVNRSRLRRLVRYFGLLLAAGIGFILLDFAIDLRPSSVHSSYYFNLGEIALDQPRILRQDNLAIVVIRRSPATVARLRQGGVRLQDPDSRDSKQPAFALNALRSKNSEWFVSYAIGTDLGCLLQVEADSLKEICGSARYDFAGRALAADKSFRNLPIPDYNFAVDFSSLTIRP